MPFNEPTSTGSASFMDGERIVPNAKTSVWVKGDKQPYDTRRPLLLTDMITAWETWEDQRPSYFPRDFGLSVETDRAHFGNTDETQWPEDKYGKRPDPYTLVRLVYATDPQSLETFTLILRTGSGHQAAENLRGQINRMHTRYPDALLLVELGWGTFKSKKYGLIPKPTFKIVGWQADPLALQQSLTAEQPKQVTGPRSYEEPTVAQELDDEIPF
jgi:hypothetical protein